VKILLAAFRYLTIWSRFTRLPPAPETIGAGAFFFPLVGLVIGSLLVAMNYLLAAYLDPEILSIALIAFLIITTGAVHLEGLKETFSSPVTTSSAPRGNETLGFIAIVLVILFKIGTADSMDEKLAVSLLLMPVLGRWALVIFIYGTDDWCDEMPRRIAENMKLWHLVVSTVATLSLVVYLLGRRGLWIGLSLSLFTLVTRALLHRRHAVLTHGNFGAVIELSEVLGLILLASL